MFSDKFGSLDGVFSDKFGSLDSVFLCVTLGSDVMSLKASVTCCDVAPPPTSRKLAGVPPWSLIMSIVAIARPAPFTETSETGCFLL